MRRSRQAKQMVVNMDMQKTLAFLQAVFLISFAAAFGYFIAKQWFQILQICWNIAIEKLIKMFVNKKQRANYNIFHDIYTDRKPK